MSRLTVKRIQALESPGMYGDGGTLFLRVAPGGSKQWIQRLTINGKRRDIGLGGWPVVTLAEARDAAIDNRRAVRAGRDPLAERRKAAMPTFREAAIRTHKSLAATWRSGKVAAVWMQRMENHAFPRLGDMPVDRIGRDDILQVLTPIWTTKAETARKLRMYIRQSLQWCVAHGFIDVNHAGENIDGALPKMPSVKQHLRALPYREVPDALETVDAGGASAAAKNCMRWVVLTACRSGEARGAQWSEIDMEARVWIVPGNRMKTGVEHRVPITDALLPVIEAARKLDDGSGLVFPSPMKRGNPISDMTLTKVLRDTGLAERATVHGFRSSFRDWCAETGKPRDIAEQALAHTVQGVEGAYLRSDILERRRGVMEAWAAHCTGERGKVVKGAFGS